MNLKIWGIESTSKAAQPIQPMWAKPVHPVNYAGIKILFKSSSGYCACLPLTKFSSFSIDFPPHRTYCIFTYLCNIFPFFQIDVCINDTRSLNCHKFYQYFAKPTDLYYLNKILMKPICLKIIQ